MTLRQIVNSDDDGDENNDDIDDDDALFALESAHTRDQYDVELVIYTVRSPVGRLKHF